jgi:hypothetical protein
LDEAIALSQSAFWTSSTTDAAPVLLEAEIAPDLDEAIAFGIQNTVRATAIPLQTERKNPWRLLGCSIACLLITLAAIFAVVFLSRARAPSTSPSEQGTNQSETQTGAASPSPSSHPSVDRYTSVQTLLVQILGEGFPSSETEEQAFYWLAYNDTAMLTPHAEGSNQSEVGLLQRFIAVLFYYETSGADWQSKDGWLSEDSICDWFGLSCASSERVSIIELGAFL